MILFFGIILTLIGGCGLIYGISLKDQANKKSMSRLFCVTSLIIFVVGILLLGLSMLNYFSN